MRRRDFLGVIGGAAVVLPLAARAEQQANMPVIGFLHSGSQEPYAQLYPRFGRGSAKPVLMKVVTLSSNIVWRTETTIACRVW
jgi:hypothetical protein